MNVLVLDDIFFTASLQEHHDRTILSYGGTSISCRKPLRMAIHWFNREYSLSIYTHERLSQMVPAFGSKALPDILNHLSAELDRRFDHTADIIST